jgi:hypothetical protein
MRTGREINQMGNGMQLKEKARLGVPENKRF